MIAGQYNDTGMAIIQVPESLYTRIVERARALKTMPDVLAVQALQQYLWQAEFDQLLDGIDARVRHVSPAEIEADITAAAEEAREQRHADSPQHHRPA